MIADLAEGRDEVGLFTFDQDLHEEQSFTYHPTGIDRAVGSVEPFGTTSLCDAIAATARRFDARLFRSPRHRRLHRRPRHEQQADARGSVCARKLHRCCRVYRGDGVSNRLRATPRPRDQRRAASEGDLRDLAQWTGRGSAVVRLRLKARGCAPFRFSRRLRHQYLIAIEAADDSDWRPIDVRVRDRKLTVRARSGYFNREASPNGRSEK